MSDTWQNQSACRGQGMAKLFFPGSGERTADAKAVCQGCLVRQECLDFALDNHEAFGIWGGLSEKERRRIRGFRYRQERALHGWRSCV